MRAIRTVAVSSTAALAAACATPGATAAAPPASGVAMVKEMLGTPAFVGQ